MGQGHAHPDGSVFQVAENIDRPRQSMKTHFPCFDCAVFLEEGLNDALGDQRQGIISAGHKPVEFGNAITEGAEQRFIRSEERTSELQSLMPLSYAVFRSIKK